MRGDLSEALDRLARRDEALRRRAESDEPRLAAEELVAAARRLVDRHPELAVTVTVESGQTRSSVRLVHGEPPRIVDRVFGTATPSYADPAGEQGPGPIIAGMAHLTAPSGVPQREPEPQFAAPTAGVRPLELGPDDVVALDPPPPTAASRLAELLREQPID
jgi:hypothetical protein